MSAPFRLPAGGGLPAGGSIDRARSLTFRFDNITYGGDPGDTLASALLAQVGRLGGRCFM